MKKIDNVRKLYRGDHFTKWFEDTYGKYFEQLFRYAFSITKNKELAEDVVSEVFTNLWHKKPDYNNIKELPSYLRVSVKHLAIRTVSKDPHHFSDAFYDETLQISDTIDPESLLIGEELEKMINEAIANLSPHARVVYTLVKTKGYTYDMVSDELSISKRTVENHMYKIIKHLKVSLQQYFHESDKTYKFFSRISTIAVLLVGFESFNVDLVYKIYIL